jgi:hypothetical protein
VLPYEQDSTLATEQALPFNETGQPNAQLAWECISQRVDTHLNLVEPFRVDIAQHFAPRYADDHAMGCYAWARIISPDAREVVIRVQRWGDEHQLFMNGQALLEQANEQEGAANFDPLRSYMTQPITLQAGANDLIFDMRGRVRQWWFFSAQIITTGDDLMTDLIYETPEGKAQIGQAEPGRPDEPRAGHLPWNVPAKADLLPQDD